MPSGLAGVRRFIKSAVLVSQPWKLPKGGRRWLDGAVGLSCSQVCEAEGEACIEDLSSTEFRIGTYGIIRNVSEELGVHCTDWIAGPISGFISTPRSRKSEFDSDRHSDARRLCIFEDAESINDFLLDSMDESSESRVIRRASWCKAQQ
eukprot:CAMPEP_0113662396 /NCGR_PEP_ID=MMETSP0038_2-20120614/546_1 /TAXON_ID=2898 /ORGANISM="Cryptomonas paramecium" /LENGTH=148 /DNA_ID=CAMNT_0000577273 /DNA_START=15 /DNA_END=458 /DNA_ORIENTATION=- /assembly_acc=CAM_ASM_000170